MNERQQILYLTGGGLDVFTHYLGDVCLKRIFKNPFREDSRPSCHLYANKNTYGQVEYYLQDFGDSSFCGNCFAIVARLCNMNAKTAFKDILKVIDKELCLGLFNNPFPQTEIIYKRLVKRQKPETSSTLSFQFRKSLLPWRNCVFGSVMELVRIRWNTIMLQAFRHAECQKRMERNLLFMEQQSIRLLDTSLITMMVSRFILLAPKTDFSMLVFFRDHTFSVGNSYRHKANISSSPVARKMSCRWQHMGSMRYA